MKTMTRLTAIIGASIALFGLTSLCQAAHATPMFVGSFQVDGGIHESDPNASADPWHWSNNPVSLTGQEAAALLFGGLPSDYFISIDPSLDPSTITHTEHTDSWGIFNDQVFAENYKVQTGTGYNDPFGGPATSAYVLDHDDDNINYVWRVSDEQRDQPVVPEPNSSALLASGGLPLLGLLRRRVLG